MAKKTKILKIRMVIENFYIILYKEKNLNRNDGVKIAKDKKKLTVIAVEEKPHFIYKKIALFSSI